jgi:hypothetical protein
MRHTSPSGVRYSLRSLVGFFLLALSGTSAFSTPLAGQLNWRDLVFTGGLSAEGYRGNLPAVTLTAVDSTEEASAAVGEMGLRGSVVLLDHEERTVTLRFDSGLRQFVAGGFKLSSYAPKELVGRVNLSYRETAGTLGEIWFHGGLSGRRVTDRPPMPLFLQPGFGIIDGRVELRLLPVGGVLYDAQLFGEMAEYSSTDATPQLALLDRKAVGVELGATWGSDWTIRGYAGFRYSEFENQGTFDPSDPLRRDKTFNLGATWTLRSSLLAQVGVEGGLNRSNSSRPEYNAVRVRAFIAVPLRQDFNISFSADLTAKDYLTGTGDALLIPGEEADNASVVYVEASRPLFLNLDGAVRFGWTRAERNIGDEYYERFGGSLLFRYRPFN